MIRNKYRNWIIHLIVFSCLLGKLVSCKPQKQNHLANATSPYLKEHIDNPVDWFEWGNEAFTKAEKEGKPLIVSIGYSSCHWCHVMEKESFMDTAVARIMNENFVCVKVDREERPDIDNMYSYASQLISGEAGWPLNCFALPDGKPFYAVTYNSKNNWITLLKNISVAYNAQRYKITLQAKMIANGISDTSYFTYSADTSLAKEETFNKNLFESIYSKIDTVWGGLRGAPKFPNAVNIEFLLNYYYRTKEKRAMDAVTTTLTRMALGGIYDQAGGGFARYSTDSNWHIPHFEKMLYDNAQLVSLYSHAFQLTGNRFYKSIVSESIEFMEKELKSPYGGYYSSINADTKNGEGEFYAWSPDELQKLFKTNYRWIASYYNITNTGNWKNGKNILYAHESPGELAEKINIPEDSLFNLLAAAKKELLAQRDKKEKPSIDSKIILSWNALLLKAYVDAYTALANKTYLAKSMALATFLEKKMIQPDGKLVRIFIDGKAQVNAFLDDYAFLAQAYLRLYQATFDKHWLDLSKNLVDSAIEIFYDPKSKFFYYTGINSDRMVSRMIEITDHDLPSSNATMAEVLNVLGTCYDNEKYLEKSGAMVSKITNRLNEAQTGFLASWGILAGLSAYGTNEVIITGEEALIKNLEIQRKYLPNVVFAGSCCEENLPLLKGKYDINQTWIYVCTNRSCKKPVQKSSEALDQMHR